MAQDPYAYPPPDQNTLRNKFDERDPDTLKGLEYAAAADRQRELESGEADVPRTYDAQHLHALHAHLFQDVYDWAGKTRETELYKGGPGGFAPPGQIDRYLADAAELIESADWASMDREQFGEHAAKVYAYVNQAHPFREGNGRAAKMFMQHVSELSPYSLDFSKVSPQAWNQRSMLTAPDLGKYEPVPEALEPVFKAIAEPRPGGPTRTMIPAELKEARRVAGLDPRETPARTTQSRSTGETTRRGTSRSRPGQSTERS
ncbi:Fic/DOC family protein [Kribbella shirazensis]|uniref:protein adenylyltransferase n=1 Tax=Kribbella shirazensis TaxID=1105143 RepID=A0A7X5V659_9ACTN|nr:Fic family protein [Kribbella shirazensis]NIK55374.1 cell filamentation protein [Kribbella shirazensis]